MANPNGLLLTDPEGDSEQIHVVSPVVEAALGTVATQAVEVIVNPRDEVQPDKFKFGSNP